MKTLISIVMISLLFTVNAQAALKNCFSISVSGKNDISLMMGSLNKKTVHATYKVESHDKTKVKEATFHIIAIGEKYAKNLYNKIMDVNGNFQKYVTVTAGEFIEGDNACNYYDSIKTDI